MRKSESHGAQPLTYVVSASVLIVWLLVLAAVVDASEKEVVMGIGLATLVVLSSTVLVHITLFPWEGHAMALATKASRKRLKSHVHASRTIAALALVSFTAGLFEGSWDTFGGVCAMAAFLLYTTICIVAHLLFRDSKKVPKSSQLQRQNGAATRLFEGT